MHCADEPAMYFANAANPYRWVNVSTEAGCRTLGFGYTGSLVFCHCGSGATQSGCGSVPGDFNGISVRSLVCACSRMQ